MAGSILAHDTKARYFLRTGSALQDGVGHTWAKFKIARDEAILASFISIKDTQHNYSSALFLKSPTMITSPSLIITSPFPPSTNPTQLSHPIPFLLH